MSEESEEVQNSFLEHMPGGHKDCMYGLQDWKAWMIGKVRETPNLIQGPKLEQYPDCLKASPDQAAMETAQQAAEQQIQVYFNLANASDTPTRAPYGSVCRAEKWQNYTKAYHLVGAGFCRPEGCDPDESSCRVNGYYGSTVTKLDCRRACELEANCIGFSFMPSRTERAAVSGCFVHTNTSTASSMPKKWVPYEKDFYSIGGASGDSLAMCYRIETKNPAEPRKSGCYFKQPTSGNGRCGGPFLTWTADNHGRKNLWSWENE
ncbi:unnamed protein product, partial [Durusdinium trenchii]